MADIFPFRGFFYADPAGRDLARLTCPPYDVISPAQRLKLLRRHRDNFVQVELPSGDGLSKYARAAKIWKGWETAGLIRRDDRPAIYAYEAAFRSRFDGRPLVRRGFFAALRVVPWGRGVHPHEKTLPTPKKDRFQLFKSLRVQTSPIQCLFRDRTRRAGRFLRAISRRVPWFRYRDEEGTRHTFWRLEVQEAAPFQKILKRSPVVIADGHHRYETSRAYSAWAGSRGGRAARCVMAYFNPTDDPGLEILPTHRSVGRDKERFVRLERGGTARRIANLRSLLARLHEKSAPRRREVGVAHGNDLFLYRLAVHPSLRKTPLAELAVASLHAGPLDGLGKEDFFFSRSPEEVLAWARRTRGWAFFLPSSTVEQVVSVAVSGHVMPPKSTYFYPKIPSGLLSHALRGDL
jgi:uncharacterized protein (DUF1015 family)